MAKQGRGVFQGSSSLQVKGQGGAQAQLQRLLGCLPVRTFCRAYQEAQSSLSQSLLLSTSHVFLAGLPAPQGYGDQPVFGCERRKRQI